MTGYKYESIIFEKKGFKCVLTAKRNTYDLVFMVGIFENEIPFIQVHFELVRYYEADDGIDLFFLNAFEVLNLIFF